MHRIGITGIGTDIGKTVVSAILTEALESDYWKPVQCGDLDKSDTMIVRSLLSNTSSQCHPESVRLQAPLSPHLAALLEHRHIHSIVVPKTSRPLIIETAGGAMVPVNSKELLFDLLFPHVDKWIIVSRHYLGSINHTLLTVEFLKHRSCPILGLIFNGSCQPEIEDWILSYTQLPFLGRLEPEPFINSQTIRRYACRWKKISWLETMRPCGIPTPLP